MSIGEAIVLSIVEGITEFLPVSSTGHMIIVSSVMGIASDPFVKTFTVAVQLGAIVSVLVLYWNRFFQSINFYWKLFLAFVPSAVLGLLLGKYIDKIMERVEVVAVALILGGIVFLFIDKLIAKKDNEQSEPSMLSAFIIGLFQCISVAFPGTSRSAATIIGGLTQKLSVRSAAEFSFFLAVPTMFAATAYKLLKYYQSGHTFSQSDLISLGVGNVVAFVVALLAIKSLMQVVSKYGFKFFGYYRIAIGVIILALYFSGVSLAVF